MYTREFSANAAVWMTNMLISSYLFVFFLEYQLLIRLCFFFPIFRRVIGLLGYSADIKNARQRLRDLERIVGGLRVLNDEGVPVSDPKVLKFLAFHKDFTDIKTHLADVGARLNKGIA